MKPLEFFLSPCMLVFVFAEYILVVLKDVAFLYKYIFIPLYTF